MDGLHTVGDIPTKISIGYVINLHDALSFMCYFMGFIACVSITVCMFKDIPCIHCMYVLTVKYVRKSYIYITQLFVYLL